MDDVNSMVTEETLATHFEQPSCGGQTTLWTTFATCWTGWGGGAGLVGWTVIVSGVWILASPSIRSGEWFRNVSSATAYVEGRSTATELSGKSQYGSTVRDMGLGTYRRLFPG